MLFANPANDAYTEDPSDPWPQAIMTCVGCAVAVCSQFVPCPNDALTRASKQAVDLGTLPIELRRA